MLDDVLQAIRNLLSTRRQPNKLPDLAIAETQQLENRLFLTTQLDLININQTGAPWSMEMVAVDDQLIYVDYDEQYGHELRIFNHVTEESSLFVDVNPGPADSLPRELVVADNKLFFVATDRDVGLEVRWVDLSDSSRQVHTVDITPGPRSAIPNTLMAVNDRIFFFASQLDSQATQTVRWLDTESPSVVHELDGATTTYIRTRDYDTAVIEDRIFFVGTDEQHGEELRWVDASLDIPVLNTVDLNPGQAPSQRTQFYSGFAQAENRLFFTGNDSDHGREFRWIDAGNPSVVHTLDFTPGSDSTPRDDFSVSGDFLFFVQAGSRDQLSWISISNPETSGVVSLGNGAEVHYTPEFSALGSRLYFVAVDDINGCELHWVDTSSSDLTTGLWDVDQESTDSNPRNLTVANSRLYFHADGLLRSISSDSTPIQATYDIAEPWSGSPWSGSLGAPLQFTADTAYAFETNESGESALAYFPVDDREAAAAKIAVFSQGEGIRINHMEAIGNQLYFSTGHPDLHVIERGSEQINHQTSTVPGASGLSSTFKNVNGKLFGNVRLENDVQAVWIEPGLEASVVSKVEVAEIGITGIMSWNTRTSVTSNGHLFFEGESSSENPEREIWSVNTTQEPYVARRIDSSDPVDFYSWGDNVIVMANDSLHGSEFRWLNATDPSLTINVLDLEEGSSSSYPRIIGADESLLYFTANTSEHGQEIRAIDLSRPHDGIQTFDLTPGSGGTDHNGAWLSDDRIYFLGADATRQSTLKYFDLTTGLLVTYDSAKHPFSFRPDFRKIGDKLFYIAGESSSSKELFWIDLNSDSPSSTQIEINQFGDSNVEHLTPVGSRLYFFADDGITGNELRWIDTLTATPTVNLTSDLAEGADSSKIEPNPLLHLDGIDLFFTATQPGFGAELHRLDVSASFDAMAGNIDRDSDFDANDSFLTQLVMLSGSDEQIESSKGASRSSPQLIRSRIDSMSDSVDVDGDNDFDANDAFLIHLLQLSASDHQIELSKGASPLSAAEIRVNVGELGIFTSNSSTTSGTQQSSEPQPGTMSKLRDGWPNLDEPEKLFENSTRVVQLVNLTNRSYQSNIETVLSDNEIRGWIDTL